MDALSYLTVRWHCGTHNSTIKTRFSASVLVSSALLACIFIGCLLILKPNLLCHSYNKEISVCLWTQTKTTCKHGLSHLSLSANLSKSYFYHKDKNPVPENFSKACFLWQTTAVLNSDIPGQKRCRWESTECTSSIWIFLAHWFWKTLADKDVFNLLNVAQPLILFCHSCQRNLLNSLLYNKVVLLKLRFNSNYFYHCYFCRQIQCLHFY